MTNEQTAVMLGGILSELETAIKHIDDVNGEGEEMLRELVGRLDADISALRGIDIPISIFSEAK